MVTGAGQNFLQLRVRNCCAPIKSIFSIVQLHAQAAQGNCAIAETPSLHVIVVGIRHAGGAPDDGASGASSGRTDIRPVRE